MRAPCPLSSPIGHSPASRPPVRARAGAHLGGSPPPDPAPWGLDPPWRLPFSSLRTAATVPLQPISSGESPRFCLAMSTWSPTTERGKGKIWGGGRVRGWPAECTCPTLQHQARRWPQYNKHRQKVPGGRTREVALDPEDLYGHSGQKPRARQQPARTERGPSPAWWGRSPGSCSYLTGSPR